MTQKTQLLRQQKIVQLLKDYECMSIDELNRKLELESEITGDDLTVKKRTLQRDKNDILELFDIEIDFDRSRKGYYIKSNANEVHNNRLFEALDTYNALNIKNATSEYIHFETRRPQGINQLHGFMHAIEANRQVKFVYKKFHDEKPALRHIDPYALKEFRYRWYVIGRDHKDNYIKSFGLDRIDGLQIMELRFDTKQKIDINKKYRDCFGIVSPNADKPSDVVISCTHQQGGYIQALPMHHSQATIEENEHEIILGLRVYLTHDLLMELLSYGENIKVLEPQILVEQMKEKHLKSYSRYEKQ